MTKHTEGPWRVTISPGKGYVSVASAPTKGFQAGRTIAHLSSGYLSIHADAALLAAAPELLDVLQRLVARGIADIGLEVEAEEAIAKALSTTKGETK